MNIDMRSVPDLKFILILYYLLHHGIQPDPYLREIQEVPVVHGVQSVQLVWKCWLVLLLCVPFDQSLQYLHGVQLYLQHRCLQ